MCYFFFIKNLPKLLYLLCKMTTKGVISAFSIVTKSVIFAKYKVPQKCYFCFVKCLLTRLRVSSQCPVPIGSPQKMQCRIKHRFTEYQKWEGKEQFKCQFFFILTQSFFIDIILNQYPAAFMAASLSLIICSLIFSYSEGSDSGSSIGFRSANFFS